MISLLLALGVPRNTALVLGITGDIILVWLIVHFGG